MDLIRALAPDDRLPHTVAKMTVHETARDHIEVGLEHGDLEERRVATTLLLELQSKPCCGAHEPRDLRLERLAILGIEPRRHVAMGGFARASRVTAPTRPGVHAETQRARLAAAHAG
jgi:hypothetical protein